MTKEFNPKEARALVERLTGYTPGPWRVAPTDDTTVICPERTVVAEIDGDYNEPDLWPVMEGNARLIAAAPDLHRHLTAALDEIERLRGAMQVLYVDLIDNAGHELLVNVNESVWTQFCAALKGKTIE
jgi:hypothetical protein